MPTRLEWEDVQARYKEAAQSCIAAKEKPAEVIEVIDDSSPDDVGPSAAAENVDDKNSVKQATVDGDVSGDVEPIEEDSAAPAVVVNPDSSITDKALTDNKKFISLLYHILSLRSSHPLSQ